MTLEQRNPRMDRQSIASKARKHWEEWLPAKTWALKQAGEFEEAIQGAALAAHRMIQELMSQGYQEHEAEEVALRQYVLLQPEKVEDEDDEELQELEENYQKNVAPYL